MVPLLCITRDNQIMDLGKFGNLLVPSCPVKSSTAESGSPGLKSPATITQDTLSENIKTFLSILSSPRNNAEITYLKLLPQI